MKDLSIPVTRDLSVMVLELCLPAWMLYPKYWKTTFFEGNEIKICPARNELAFIVLRLCGFPFTDFSDFCVKTFEHVDSSAGSMFSSVTGIFVSGTFL